MDEPNNVKILENYIAWIDAIVTLCRNLDQACTNLDHKFPSELNSSRLLSYIKVINDNTNITSSKYKNTSRYKRNNNNNYTEINEDYYNPKRTKKVNNINNRSKNKENLGGDEGEEDEDKRGNKKKNSINREEEFYGLVIKGLKSKQINNKKTEYIYKLESDIMKKLPVGEKLCLIKKTHTSDDIILIKYTREFDHLLDKPFEITPNRDTKSHYKSNVSGVYWDKRSWIASWYKGGKRFYRSFSSKLYGFYRSKYFAIHSRLYNLSLDDDEVDSDKNEK